MSRRRPRAPRTPERHPLTVLTAGVALLAGILLVSVSSPAQAVVPIGQRSPPDVTPHPMEERLPGRSIQVIGESVSGEPLIVHRFGTGQRKRMIVAGIHGGYEWNTTALAEELIDFLDERPGLIPEDMSLYILPLLNPDGAARSRGYEGRANENGVDLNRNFPHNWQSSWDPAGCWDFLPIGGGDHPWSEPETWAVSRFILSKHIEALISYHSAALGIFAGGRPPYNPSIDLAEEIAGVTDYQYPPRDTGCEYTGQLTDWAAANGVAAVDIELTTHYGLDYEENLRALLAFLYWQR